MNQILSISNDNDNNNKGDIKKVIVFFCMSVIIIALGIILLKVYGIYQNKQKLNNFPSPEIQIEVQSSSQITINAECEDGIDYIIYSWNESNENRVNLNGATTFKRIVSIPYNKENVLKIDVISVNGIQSELTKTFGMEVDEKPPEIVSLSVTGSKLSLEVSDDSGIDYIEYQWEEEEANKVIPEEGSDKRSFSTQINIQRGTHKLTIRIVDIHGNEEKTSRLVTGVNEPEILVLRYDDVINVKATHDMGIKQISVLINDKLYTFNENDPDYVRDTTLQKDFPLEEGENTVRIIVHSFEKLSDSEDESLNNYAYKTFVGTCTYEPTEE